MELTSPLALCVLAALLGLSVGTLAGANARPRWWDRLAVLVVTLVWICVSAAWTQSGDPSAAVFVFVQLVTETVVHAAVGTENPLLRDESYGRRLFLLLHPRAVRVAARERGRTDRTTATDEAGLAVEVRPARTFSTESTPDVRRRG